MTPEKQRNSYDDFRVTGLLPERTIGTSKVCIREVDAFGALRAKMKGEALTEGEKLTTLFVNGELMMSDSIDEWRSHSIAIRRAYGRVLIHGLGLGCYLKAILSRLEVSHVDVVEINNDVLNLVSPYFNDCRIQFHCADAFKKKWPRGSRWNVVWHDIWTNICADDLPEHFMLLRSFAKRSNWQAAWQHERLVNED